MLGHRFFVVIAVLGAGLCAGNARAQNRSGAAEMPASGMTSVQTDELRAREKAKLLYDQGLAAYREGRYSDAVDKLLEADQVMPNAAFSYNIALVYEAMGDKRSALRWLRSHVRQSDDETETSATLAKVRKLEAELQVQGLQQVTIISKPSGATVWIDGHALGITPFTTEITPGSHFASLALDGYAPEQKTFELRPERSMDVEVVLVASKAPVPRATPAAASPEVSRARPRSSIAATETVAPTSGPERQSPRVRPWTWIGFGLGTALFGGVAYFEVKRRHAEDAARGAAQLDYQSHFDEMDSPQTMARILAVAGSLAMTAGLTSLAIDLTRSGPAAKGQLKTATLGSCATRAFCVAIRGQL